MDAGIYQQVRVPAGAIVDFSIHAHAWCSNSNDPRVSDGEMYCMVGIDPTGGVDPWADSVVWDPPNWEFLTAEWKELSVGAVAQGSRVTVFVRSWNKWKLRHNDVYVDAATLTISGGGEPGDGGGSEPGVSLTEQQVEDACERAVRRVLGSVNVGITLTE
jgi:hypothetical protein